MNSLFDGRLAGRGSMVGAPRIALLIAALVALAGCSDSTKSAAPDAGHTTKPDASAPDASMSEGVEQIQIKVADLTFDARAAGPTDGELVLFLHGFPETSYEWRHQLAPFAAAGYRAVAPDQRGYSPGARPTSVDDYGILMLAQDVVSMAGALGATRYHVVGHDWGAAVAWTVAKLDAAHVITANPMSVPHPDAFSKQLADMSSCQYSASSYFDTFTMPNSEDGYLAGDAGQLRGLYVPTDFMSVDEYLRVLGKKEALGAALNWYRANFDGRKPKFTGMLGDITVPTMFVWSDQDVALCREGAEDTANYVTGPYRFEVLTGVSHWIADTASDRLTPLLLDHIGQYREKK